MTNETKFLLEGMSAPIPRHHLSYPCRNSFTECDRKILSDWKPTVCVLCLQTLISNSNLAVLIESFPLGCFHSGLILVEALGMGEGNPRKVLSTFLNISKCYRWTGACLRGVVS